MDFVPPAREILAEIGTAGEIAVTLHDGSVVRFKQTPEGYDPTNRSAVHGTWKNMRERAKS